MIDLIIRNAKVHEKDTTTDIAIDKGIIIEIGSNIEYLAEKEMDVCNRLVIPAFVESHLHLDIALSNDAHKPGRDKPFIYPSELNQRVLEMRKSFTQQDIVSRASKAVELAIRHGITAIRAQCHVDNEIGLKHVYALEKVRSLYNHCIDIQIVAFPERGLLSEPGTLELFKKAFENGANIMGCAPDLESIDGISFRDHIDAALELAIEMKVDLDMHLDLGLPPLEKNAPITLDDLEVVYAARRIIEREYQGIASAGHLCTLSATFPDVAKQAIDIIKKANINVISQPDMYRLGRADLWNIRRGLTRVKELLDAGVNVAFASNNVRDPYRPMGNLNLLEEGLVLAYGAHMDTNEDLNNIIKMCTYNAAKILNLEKYGLKQGCKADLVILDASSPAEAIINQCEKSYVLKNGKIVAENYKESAMYCV
jgi:cytosine deaminase